MFFHTFAHKSKQIMRLIIMTEPAFFVEEDQILSLLFEQGMDSLHICKTDISNTYTERLLSLIPEEYRKKTWIHDCFQLKEKYQLAGIHVDDEKTAVPNGYKGHAGRTCHDILRLRELKKQSNPVFLANTFAATDNPSEDAPYDISTLEEAADEGLIDKRVYAYGGVRLENIRTAKSIGFGGVVVRTDLWSRFNKHNQTNFDTILRHFEALRKAIG